MWFVVAAVLVTAVIVAGGGNTAEGFGDDVERTGDKLDRQFD